MKENQNLLAIASVIESIANAKNTIANARKTVADILPVILESLKSKDFEKAGKLLYRKIGKISFYNAFLRDFFKSQHFILEYNITKDKIEWYGSFESIQPEKYLEYFESQKEERAKEKASLSMEKRIEKDFSRIEKLSKVELEYLAKLINSKLHKKQ